MKKQQLALVSRVDGYVSQIRNHLPLLLGGAAISPTNRIIFMRFMEFWLILVEDLMLRSGLNESQRIARMDNMFHACVSCDFIDVLSFLDGVFLTCIGEEVSIDDVKNHQLISSSGLNVSGRLLSPINHVLYPFLSESDIKKKAYFCAILSHFLRFPRKLEFQDIGLEDQALQDYVKTEEELATVNYDEADTDGVSQIIEQWFRGFHIESLKPNHGPGSVAEGPLTLAAKYEQLSADALLRIGMRNCSFPDSYKEFYPYQPGENVTRISRTIFVPKTATKLRTISMEPVALQYTQQGVMKEIYRYIETHPYLGVRVKLRDQTQNQVLCLEGSIYQNYGTIDLSKASDTVSWDLVRKLFKSVPRLYKWLLMTRSNKTLLPDGQVMHLKKFAPMGSALCFPVQCIIFAAIIEQASREMCKHYKMGTALYSVYGDDLIVPTIIYDRVCTLLSQFGFCVNGRKSYGAGPFRESCGKDYYAGVDISALYYRIPFYSNRMSPSAYESLCSLANNALLHGLPLLRNYVINIILGERRRFGPYFGYSPELSPDLYSSAPTNFHVKARWNRNYQRFEARFSTVKSRQRDGELTDDTLRYFSTLVEMAWRKNNRHCFDVSPSLKAMHGCVEFFSSTVKPITPFIHPNRMLSSDWSDTET